jgi:hypothetical protein
MAQNCIPRIFSATRAVGEARDLAIHTTNSRFFRFELHHRSRQSRVPDCLPQPSDTGTEPSELQRRRVQEQLEKATLLSGSCALAACYSPEHGSHMFLRNNGPHWRHTHKKDVFTGTAAQNGSWIHETFCFCYNVSN